MKKYDFQNLQSSLSETTGMATRILHKKVDSALSLLEKMVAETSLVREESSNPRINKKIVQS